MSTLKPWTHGLFESLLHVEIHRTGGTGAIGRILLYLTSMRPTCIVNGRLNPNLRRKEILCRMNNELP